MYSYRTLEAEASSTTDSKRWTMVGAIASVAALGMVLFASTPSTANSELYAAPTMVSQRPVTTISAPRPSASLRTARSDLVEAVPSMDSHVPLMGAEDQDFGIPSVMSAPAAGNTGVAWLSAAIVALAGYVAWNSRKPSYAMMTTSGAAAPAPTGPSQVSDYVAPVDVVAAIATAGAGKTKLGEKDMVVRGMYSGALLGFATTLAVNATVQTGKHIVGSLLFPTGFVMILLFGLELVTGNFMAITTARLCGKAETGPMLKNWAYVAVGNFIGSVLYAAMYALVITDCFTSFTNPLGAAIKTIALGKTVHYASLGAAKGFLVPFTKAILCNWMVCLGTVSNFVTSSVIGRIALMWIPILTFFAQQYEHLVVNMFMIPCAMLLGAPITVSQFFTLNLLPVLLGNIVGGALFVALPFVMTNGSKAKQ